MEEDQDRLAEIIGKNIMRLRKMANMTQSDLAEQLNYSDKSVSKWEQGNGIPDVRILVRLSELFGVTLDELSMGMSGDFELAIAEGATTVRVGRAIFGERPKP